MNIYYILVILLSIQLSASELKIKADSFNADLIKGISIFDGNVSITNDQDKLKASNVKVFVDKKNKPKKFIATGNVVFNIQTEKKIVYNGRAQKVIFYPQKKEYHFFKSVRLLQKGNKKEIVGNEVVLKTDEGKAYAKGTKFKPVIMIFQINDKKK